MELKGAKKSNLLRGLSAIAPCCSFLLPPSLYENPGLDTAFMRSPREKLSRELKRVVRFAVELNGKCLLIESIESAREHWSANKTRRKHGSCLKLSQPGVLTRG